jgi:hypothetical protein
MDCIENTFFYPFIICNLYKYIQQMCLTVFPLLNAYPLLQNSLPGNGQLLLLNYSIMLQYYKSQHIPIKFV